jgi:hypothetical protein
MMEMKITSWCNVIEGVIFLDNDRSSFQIRYGFLPNGNECKPGALETVWTRVQKKLIKI